MRRHWLVVFALGGALGCSGPEGSGEQEEVGASESSSRDLPADGTLEPVGGGGAAGGEETEPPPVMIETDGTTATAAAGAAGAPTGEAGAAAEPPLAAREVVVLLESGQSNADGRDAHDPPPGLPDASIPFWRSSLEKTTNAHRFIALNVNENDGSFSHELRLAQLLKAAGREVAVIKLVQGATYIGHWLPGALAPKPGAVFYDELDTAVHALRELYPDSTMFRFVWVWDQGENEARLSNQQTVEAWSDCFFTIRAEIERRIRQPLDPYVVRTWSLSSMKTFPGLLEAEQASVVSSPSHLFDTNELKFLRDNLHRTGASQNTLGETIGQQILSHLNNER